MSYEDITEKINKYSNTYANGECRSKEYEARIQQEKALNKKLDLADGMFNEITFPFTQNQKDHVKHLIETFPNFTKLYNNASNEEIITAFIFYVKALEDKKNIINETEGQETLRALIPKIKRQLLFPNMFEIISWKINLHYISNTPILPVEPKNIDHNILYKGIIPK